MKIRLAFLTITLIAVISAYFSYSSYIQTKNYENYLVEFDNRLVFTASKYTDVQEEDAKLNAKIDALSNKINVLNEQIRIQNVLINEMKTRSKRK